MPQFIGRFQIRSKLGSGTYGQVYQAFDPVHNREVAIKVPDGHGLSEQGLNRFRRESEAAMRISHPNLCRVYEAAEHQGRPFLVMEYIPGQSLEAFLQERQRQRLAPLTPFECFGWIHTLAEAMHAAHEKGVIHRDLKPGNIVCNEKTNQLVIVDWGLAKLVDTKDLKLTDPGRPLGTVLYMPPEQANGDLDQIGPHSDTYSLGAILYELLCGRTAFQGNTPLQVIGQLVSRDPQPPSHWRADLPPTADEICLKAMARRPENRYRSCQALAEALHEYLAFHGVSSPGEIVLLAGSGSLAPQTRPFGESNGTDDPHRTRSPLAEPPSPPPTKELTKSQIPIIFPPSRPSDLPKHAAAETKPNSEARTILTKDDRFHTPRPVVSGPIAWGDLVRVTVGFLTLALFGTLLTVIVISLGFIPPPSWTPDWLRPVQQRQANIRDRQVLEWALKEGQGTALVELNATGQSVAINNIRGLATLEPARLVELKLDDATKITDDVLRQQLWDLPHLRKLDLSGCTRLEQLDFLAQLPALESLDLSRGAFPHSNRTNEDQVIQSIINCPKLASLNLADSPFPIKLLPLLKEVVRLNLGGANSEQVDSPVCEQLAKLPKLQVLELSRSSIGNEGAVKLLVSKSLRSLDLSSTAITDTFCTRVGRLEQLEMLNLSDCRNISGASIRELAKLRFLRELYLNRLRLSDDDLIKLEGLTRLQVLQLSQCEQISLQGIKSLKCAQLEELTLDGTRVGDDLLRDLGQRHPQLRRLNLANTGITRLGEPFHYLPPSLNELHLSGASITPLALSSLPGSTPGLRSLGLAGDRLTDELLKRLLQQLPQLDTLILVDCGGVTNDSFDALLTHQKLRRLRLIRTGMTAGLLETLREKRPTSEVKFIAAR